MEEIKKSEINVFLEDLLGKIYHPNEYRFIDNFDDIADGWQVRHSWYLQYEIMVDFERPYWIRIIAYKINTFGAELCRKHIYSNNLPSTMEKEPDLKFLETIIRHIESFAR